MTETFHDLEYFKLVNSILETGEVRGDRTGTGTISKFGHMMEFDVSNSIPLLTTKKVNFDSILKETLWMFVEGSTNANRLKEQGVNIWNNWGTSTGDLGPIYGKQARGFQSWKEVNGITQIEEVDQISNVIESIKNTPNSRRHVLTLWNPSTTPPDSNNFSKLVEEGYSSLSVCHGALIQFYVHTDKRLSIQVNIRSNDVLLGNPYNLINYTLLLYMIANVCNLKPNKLNVVLGDAHIYSNHIDNLKLQLSRDPFPSPSLIINPEVNNFNNYKIEDFQLINYQHHSPIKGAISV